jgi:hypothetical protein
MESENKRIDPRAAYCGLFCGACPVLVATRETGGLDAEGGKKLECSGCRSESTPPWCAECGLKSCARERRLDFCGQCGEYPCAKFVSFRDDPRYPYHGECPEYLSAISEKGWRAWLSDMEGKWTCPDCGRPAAWWDETCQACGIRMPGFRKP